ncbi:hypothetical protein [Lactococcus lactis]
MTFEEAKEKINELFIDPQVPGYSVGDFDPEFTGTFEDLEEIIESLEEEYSTTDKLSVEKLQEELESCIQTLITISILANGDENIVIGNFVDSRLSKLAKTHENVTKYIEKVTGKNIDVVLAENAALEAEEEQ